MQRRCGPAGVLRTAADLARDCWRRRARKPGSWWKALYPIAARGEKILFCEPSCLSVVKEDAASLLRGEQQEKARTVAGRVLLFEEFAATLDLPLRTGPSKILLHGHCHQKSMGLLDATKSLLARIPGAPWSIWMRAAAAWRDRSATRRSTTTSR